MRHDIVAYMRTITIVIKNPNLKDILRYLTQYTAHLYNTILYAYNNQHVISNKTVTLHTQLYRYARKSDYGKLIPSTCTNNIVKEILSHKKEEYTPSKQKTRHSITYTKPLLKVQDNYILLPLTKQFQQKHNISEHYLRFQIPDKIKDKDIVRATITPKYGARFFILSITYKEPIYKQQEEEKEKRREKEREKEKESSTTPTHVMGIDLGVNNFATIAISDGTALIIDGKKIKSINQYFNKQMARLQSTYSKQNIPQPTNKTARLQLRRSNIINDFIHKTARFILTLAQQHNVSTIVIGYSKNWKNKPRLSKTTKQNFLSIPHARFISTLKHKATPTNITIITTNEAYTSKTDALALEPITKNPLPKGRRLHRGLFQSSTNILINADVNAAINIARKITGDKPWIPIITHITHHKKPALKPPSITQPKRIYIT